jgi:cyclohexa-1,5-dienecarbonyl-CoA hydratase
MTSNTTTTQLQRIALVLEPPFARVTLNNPPLNVIDLQMMDELIAVMEQVERPEIVAVIISGVGRNFSAGVDIAVHTPDKIHGMLVKFHSVIRAIVATPKITIAQVEGACLGGGAELALVCDMVYTARDASWAFPEIKLACFPPVAAAALASVVGPKRAAELIFTGRQISGDEALAIGLATRAARREELESLVDDALAHLDPLSSVALGLTKKAFYAWDSMHFDKGLARAEQVYLNELVKTADSVEGIQAWMEKRAPVWKGK